jgi:hypothetical protein
MTRRSWVLAMTAALNRQFSASVIAHLGDAVQ